MTVPHECRFCRWWLPFDVDVPMSVDFFGDCTLLSVKFGHNPEQLFLRVVPLEQFSGVLTAPDFGCCKWEPMESSE